MNATDPNDMVDTPRRLHVLGSTGSIGVSTLEVIESLERSTSRGPRFEVVSLAAGVRAGELEQQAARFGVTRVAIGDEDGRPEIDTSRTVWCGPQAATEMIAEIARPGDLVVAAMVGAAGIPAVVAGIEAGCDIALANKETLVAAGELVTRLARDRGVELLPVDSEHAALHQCLRSGRGDEEVSKIVLTASGGPFRSWSSDRMKTATVDEALAHPTWSMGPKVTIDSASMMNKGLEMIEAHWLFGIDADRIEVVIHPQSIVHSFVEFRDGSSLAQLSPPDMRMPIQYAICYPHRVPGCAPALDYAALRNLAFEPVDHDKFPAIELARRAIRSGGTSGAVLNAANETAVEAFLKGRITFGDISETVAEACGAIEPTPARTLADVRTADEASRAFVRSRFGARIGSD